jgi:hypothetical protein
MIKRFAKQTKSTMNRSIGGLLSKPEARLHKLTEPGPEFALGIRSISPKTLQSR